MTLLAPDSGMAMGIGLVMLCLLLVPCLVLGTIGYALAPKERRYARAIGVIGGVLAGPVVGLVIVKVAFDLPWSYFHDRIAPPPPPPELHIEVPPECEHDWLVLVEDPSAPGRIDDLDPSPRVLRIAAPASCFMRVRSIEPVLRAAPITVHRTSGPSFVALMPSSRALPTGITGAAWTEVFIGERSRFPSREQSLDAITDEAALAHRLRALERGAP